MIVHVVISEGRLHSTLVLTRLIMIVCVIIQMRFLDGGTKQPSKSILDVGVQGAIDGANFDDKMFLKRGGKYIWSKADMNLEW